MYIFDPASPRPVAVQEAVSRKTDIVSAAFDPTSLVSCSTDEKVKMSKLYFLSGKQVCWCYLHTVIFLRFQKTLHSTISIFVEIFPAI